MQSTTQNIFKIFLVTIFIVIAISLFSVSPAHAEIYALSGNSTIVERVGFPVVIEKGQIQPGETWTYIYTLKGGHKYHIYLVGDWVNLDKHLTDYDVYVYRARKATLNFISSHTEAAGYPEQVSNDEKGWYFTPEETATYYLCVRNDPNDSTESEAATLMVIETIDPDIYYRIEMMEPADDYIEPESSYAFEFITDQPRITVDVSVPNSLDMYEARLYPMANLVEDVGTEIDGLITPWSPGLLGKLNKEYGGFNDDPQGYRNYEASDSCERNGDDMHIDFNGGYTDPVLYYLVLIAENGEGYVTFVLRTDFDPPNITLIDPPSFVTSDEPFQLKCNITDISDITQVDFRMSTNGKQTWKSLDYNYSDGIYSVTVPAQKKGTIIDYYWEATDSLGNNGKKSAQAKAMNPTEMVLVVDPEMIYGGEKVISKGTLNLPYKEITLYYTRETKVVQFNVTTDDDGHFTHTFMPNQIGEWSVAAQFFGDEVNWPSNSSPALFEVKRKPTTLSINVSRDWIGLGDYVNVTGQFSEKRIGYEVFITARNGFNSTSLFALTDENGSYQTVFQPDKMGTWTLYAEVAADGIYTDSATSLADTLNVGDPTLAYRVTDFKQNMFKPPYVYGVGTFLGASIAGSLAVAQRKGLLKNPLKRGEPVEEPQDVGVEEEEEDEFDF